MARGVQADHETDDSSGGGGGGGGGAAALALWDCGSALYDSYELAAFKRQLEAAVSACSRSLSMPHLRAAAPAPAAGTVQPALGRHRRRARRLPALLRRLFSKVLRLRFPARRDRYQRGYDGYGGDHGNSCTGSPWSGALTSIPEESASPEMGSSPADAAGPSTLRRAQSDRFIGSKTASPMVQFEVVL